VKQAITPFIVIMLLVLSLYAGNLDHEEKGFTVTHLMLERQNIELPQDQIEQDTNSSGNTIQ